MKRAPVGWWWVWKHYPFAYAPEYSGRAIGDQDGEWRAIGFGFFRLVVDLRNVGPMF